jgi:copper chaperone CopZ
MGKLKDVQADFEAMDMLKDNEITGNASEEVNELLNEACEIITLLEDISGLSKHGYPDNSIEAQVETFFKKITAMNEETCPKCDQHPYSETDRHCPVCFDEIKENK